MDDVFLLFSFLCFVNVVSCVAEIIFGTQGNGVDPGEYVVLDFQGICVS